ncbi:hypothetical protein QBC42DRAFT_175366 [Cladorrhinum samala]|uniref:Vegetative cell wall protein gp1 n=1 Tax=Cladorrhinum samala TaxID=585594 RepID=A0AAV9HSN2_9PEZI|nr:hypothetical protein QBC42DRAFT_175366 [Cladorrhinum samala]
MATFSSPYGSTPAQEYFFDDKFPSASTTPSPRGTPAFYYGPTPQRPATRAHFRNSSTTGFNTSSRDSNFPSPRGPSFSPRYTSDGTYATANVSSSRSRKPSFSSGSPAPQGRRKSFSHYRMASPNVESDEEIIEVDGKIFRLSVQSSKTRPKDYFTVNAGGHGTDYRYYAQGGPYFDRESGFASPRFDADRRPAGVHARRSSTSVPQRPQTARPVASQHKKPPPPPVARQATEADAKRHRIPTGYSLKNWDPTEEPIMLLGSVFDANSLGKWIYDWTVYHHGPSTPISDMAGELWLLLIQLAGKIKRAEESIPRIRIPDSKEMVEEFIEAGERLTDKLRKLLKSCEAPMLRARQQRKDSQLGKNAGVEFVETLFGRERELEKTEKFMHSVRLWNLRFDTNCEDIIRNPTV